MLLKNEQRDVNSSTALETARATIKASPKIFDFFANQTYANKQRAICRELVANAVDSHTMAGKPDLPVEVWLPTLIDPVFKVRDHGLGMPHDFVMGPFMAYADGSTKDGSNIAIGGFGIGSKSPFAYVDQFTLKSIFDGTMSVYSVFKDSDGIPAIALLAQQTTDEPNGVEVSFPVEVGDFKSFEEAAFESLKYFEPLPDIKNATTGKFEAPKYISKGKLWRMRPSGGDLAVIMGGVRYPVDSSNITYKLKDTKARAMLNYGLDLVLPIGTCAVALSREGLSYDDKTIQALQDAMLAVIDEVAATFSTLFDGYKTKWEACQALYKEAYPNGYGYYGGVSTRANFLIENAQYKGQPLKLDMIFNIPPQGTAVWDIERKANRRGSRCPSPKWSYASHDRSIRPGSYEHVIIDDLPRSPKSRFLAKVSILVDSLPQDKNILVIRAQDEKVSAKTILKALGDPPSSVMTLASTLPDPPVNTVTSTKAGYVRPHIRMFTYDGHTLSRWNNNGIELNADGQYINLNPGYYKKGVLELDYKDQPDKGIYVPMENFRPGDDFYTKMKTDLIDWSEVHFINKGDAPKLDKKRWDSFNEVFEKRLQKMLAKYPNLGEQLAVLDAMEINLQKLFRNNTFKLVRGSLFQLQELYREYVANLGSERKYRAFVKVALPKGVDVNKLWGDFQLKSPRAYRLLQLTDFDLSHTGDKAFFEENL